MRLSPEKPCYREKPGTGETISPPTPAHACPRDSVLASGKHPRHPAAPRPPPAPPFTGGWASVWRLPRWPCTEQEWNFPNGFGKTPERCHPRTPSRWGIAARGYCGLRGGGWQAPTSPVFAYPGNCLAIEHSNLPAAQAITPLNSEKSFSTQTLRIR